MTTEDKVNQAEELVQRFAEALRGQMGRSENTVRVYTTDLRPYLAFLEQEDLDVRGPGPPPSQAIPGLAVHLRQGQGWRVRQGQRGP